MNLRVCRLLALTFCWSFITAEVGAEEKIIPDVVYGHKHGMALTFDVFQPTDRANGAGVLFMVSGGWRSRWSPPERSVVRYRALLNKGFTVFAVRHGSSPTYDIPEIVADVRRSVRFIRLHGSEYDVDPNRLGVYGGSAGGHLSLVLGTASDDGNSESRDEVDRTSNRVAAVVAYFPPTDLRHLVPPRKDTRFPALKFDPAKAADYSPIVHVTPDDPPTLLIHGDQDTLVPLTNSTKILAEFEKRKVTSELIVMKGARHGFRGEDARKASAAMVAWFEKHLAAK